MRCSVINCEAEAEERYSLGIYAGKYCVRHFAERFRDEPASAFDPFDAGESYEPDWDEDEDL